MAKRYANLDCFTKSYPGPRGGSVCFTPGEAREGNWWSRFSGKEGLTEVGPDYNPSRDFKKFGAFKPMPVVSPRVVAEASRGTSGCNTRCDSSCQVSCEGKCQMACEASKQTIQVTDNYEKIGVEFYCRHCDWSTQDAKRVEEHMAAYHPDQVQGSVEEADSESRPEQQDAVDPGEDLASSPEARSVPARGSPPPGTSKKQKKKKKKVEKEPPCIKENEYWEIMDGLFLCLSCRKNAGVKWSTASRPAMIRHAKRYHGYEDEKSKAKKAAGK